MDDVMVDRQRIRDFVPLGWAAHHARLTYGFEASGPPVYGVCGHRHVCLLRGAGWVHPYPTTPVVCDDQPTVHHVGIW